MEVTYWILSRYLQCLPASVVAAHTTAIIEIISRKKVILLSTPVYTSEVEVVLTNAKQFSPGVLYCRGGGKNRDTDIK